LVDGVEEFIVKPFLVKDLVRVTKKVVDRLHLEKMQKHAARPGIIQGRLEEMSMTDLLQSLEMGQNPAASWYAKTASRANSISLPDNAATPRSAKSKATTPCTK